MKNDFIVEQLTRDTPQPTPPPELRNRLLQIAHAQERRVSKGGSWSLTSLILGIGGVLIVTACLLAVAGLSSPAGLHATLDLYDAAVRVAFAIGEVTNQVRVLALAAAWTALGLVIAGLCLRWQHR